MPPPKRRDWSWRSQAFRGLVYQIVAIALVALGVWFLAHNTLENMRVRGIQSGFDFLTTPAGFDIGETLFNYDALDPYWKAFLVGVLNTLRVAIIGVVLTTILGTLLGVGRFSRNALVRGLCYGYVELFRNIPVLLQLLMWYLLFTELLPDPFDPVSAFGLFLPQQGRLLAFRCRSGAWGRDWRHVGALVGLLAGPGLPALGAAQVRADRAGAQHVLGAAGDRRRCRLAGLGRSAARRRPGTCRTRAKGMVEGGAAVTPEFMAVLLGLVFYTSAFIAEVVRAGIQSVSHGQVEAASSLGLSRAQVDAARDPAAGAARDHPAADQPVPEPDEELVAGGGDRLSGRGVDRATPRSTRPAARSSASRSSWRCT